MAKTNWEKNLVRKPRYEVSAGNIKGRQYPTMTLMSSDLVPGSNTYIEVGWVWDMPDPNPHIHEHTHKEGCNEIVLHIGGDHKHPEDLGAEIEFTVDNEKHIITKSFAAFVPAGVQHGPLIIRKVVRPIFHFMAGPTKVYK